MSAQPLQVCPKDLCPRKKWGRGRVKRKISAGGGLLFKGSGFYVTDYRSDSYKRAAQKDSTPAKSPGSDTPSAPKTETKPVKPTPAKA